MKLNLDYFLNFVDDVGIDNKINLTFEQQFKLIEADLPYFNTIEKLERRKQENINFIPFEIKD